MFWSEIIFLTNVNLLLRIEQRSILNTSLSHDLSFLSNQNDQFGVTVTHLHQYHNKYTLKIYLEYIGGGGGYHKMMQDTEHCPEFKKSYPRSCPAVPLNFPLFQ